MTRVLRFYGIAFAGPLLAMVAIHFAPAGATLFAAGAMLAPGIATLLSNRLDGRSSFDGLAAIRPSRWLLFAGLIGLFIPYAAIAASPFMPGGALDWEMAGLTERLELDAATAELVDAQLAELPLHPALLAIPQALIAGFTVNALFAFGEELGWRGWLHRELAPLGFWRATVLTGVLWGLWHAPLIAVGHNYPTRPIAGILLFTVFCVFASPVLSYVRERSGSVWAAAFLHGTLNAAGGVGLLVLDGPELWIGVQGVAGVLVLAVLTGGIAWLRRSAEPDVVSQGT